MSLGSSSTLPNASILNGRNVVYIEPITKVNGDFVEPFFRKKERAPEGAERAWIVTNDTEINFVEGYLVRGAIEMRDPHPSSGLSGQIPVVNLYLLDADEGSDVAYILETKMTTLGRDIINSVLNFTEFEKILRIRLYSYRKDGKTWAGVTFETDLGEDSPTVVEWKFDKSKYLKAKPVQVGNRTEYDWSEVDNFLLCEFEEYTHLLSGSSHSPAGSVDTASRDSSNVAEERGRPDPEAPSSGEPKAGVGQSAGSSRPDSHQEGFNPRVPGTRRELIEYGAKVFVFETESEVEAFVDQFIEDPDVEPDLATRKQIFWRLLNLNVPKVMDETSEPLDPFRMVVYLARSPLYDLEPPSKAVHLVARNFKRFIKEECKGKSFEDSLKLFIKSQNALLAEL